jgi:hypothetical protein
VDYFVLKSRENKVLEVIYFGKKLLNDDEKKMIKKTKLKQFRY